MAANPSIERTHNWQITIPEDGGLPLEGVAPVLIQWPAGIHPTSTLKDMGCSLKRLEGFHPDAKKVNSVLEAIGFQGDFRVSALPPGQQPFLLAHIRTPNGLRQLSYPDFVLNADERLEAPRAG